MNHLLSILFLFLIPANLELAEVRKQYYTASLNKENAEKFYQTLLKCNSNNPTLIAYKGASITLKAKFSSELLNKKNLFIEGAKIIESAQQNDPQNIEIRLIRLSIQENIPKILKYKQNIEEDKNFILQNFEKQSPILKDYIRTYVKQSASFSEKEKQSILK